VGGAFGGRSEVKCITVDPQDNVTGRIMHSGIWMCCAVVEELNVGLHGILHVLGLWVVMVPSAVSRVLSTAWE